MRASSRLLATLSILPFAFALMAEGCSAPDPGGYVPYRSTANGTPTGPQSSPTTAPTHTTNPAPTNSPPAQHDSGAPQPLPDYDAGLPSSLDSGKAKDSGTTTTGQPGSCSNPACGTLNGQCGCKGGDNGSVVLMGCDQGGQCACFQNNQQTSNAFDENGACGDSAALAALFIANCTCP